MATGACFGGYWNRCARGPQLAAEALNCRAASQWQLSWQIKLMISFDLKLKRYDFSLDVSGEFDDGITAIFGPSGAGKSTLLNCIAGSLRPDAGRIELDGGVVFSSVDAVWTAPDKRRIGTVYQDGALFPHLDIQGNIEFGYRLIPQAIRRFDPLDLAEFLGLSALLARKPGELSGGERQRVAIARALAISPGLLLLDEPLASLDAARRGSILNYLRRVHAEFKIPMIYVSHSITEVVSIASKAMLLRDGSVVGFDRPSALLLRAAALGDVVATDTAAEYTRAERFENILDGVIGESTGHSTMVRIGDLEISTRRQNRNPGEKIVVSLGASQIILASSMPQNLSARNIVKGTVAQVWSSDGLVFTQVDAGPKIIVEITENAMTELGVTVGNDVFLVFKSSSVDVFDA
ncbi:MAG: molybdenum ABC transporter ATP-binding protein [Dehalococcoidia bacterium]|nr:molybdenum ABC transporter ATP-binding protein [Dehalococcoidia bacterium]